MINATHESKTALFDAALSVIRAKGYAATRIEDICASAKLTKGSFFHHFKTKEDLAIGAAEHWTTVTTDIFARAKYQSLRDPLDRLFGYIDFRKALITGPFPEFTCLAGTMIQEVYDTHPAVRDACERSISEHVAMLKSDIDEVIRKRRMHPPLSTESLALYIQAVIQGGFHPCQGKAGSGGSDCSS